MNPMQSLAVVMSIAIACTVNTATGSEQPLHEDDQTNRTAFKSGLDLSAKVASIPADRDPSNRPFTRLQPDEGLAAGSAGQEDAQPSRAGVDVNDKTGTNPIAFTYDLRFYHEYRTLNTAGDGDQHISTMELRVPIIDGKYQFRVRARHNMLEADLTGNGSDDVDESGFGDMDFRLLAVPYVNMKKKFAFAAGIEVFLDTASDDALGSGSTSLGPQVFAVFFKPFDSSIISLIAPAYQHKFSIDGNDVSQGLIDIFILTTSKDKTFWVLLDPQIILDFENEKEFVLIDAEAGMMLDSFLGVKGKSVYLRPSVGFGHDRPYEQSLELGFKMIW